MRTAIGVQMRAESALIRPKLSRTTTGHLRWWALAFLLTIRCGLPPPWTSPPKFWPVTSRHSTQNQSAGKCAGRVVSELPLVCAASSRQGETR